MVNCTASLWKHITLGFFVSFFPSSLVVVWGHEDVFIGLLLQYVILSMTSWSSLSWPSFRGWRPWGPVPPTFGTNADRSTWPLLEKLICWFSISLYIGKLANKGNAGLCCSLFGKAKLQNMQVVSACPSSWNWILECLYPTKSISLFAVGVFLPLCSMGCSPAPWNYLLDKFG